MVTFSRTPRKEVREAHAASRASKPQPEPPEIANVSHVVDLGADMVLRIGDQAVLVPPVPYRAGLQLERIHLDIVALSDSASPEEALPLIERAVALMRTLVRPVGPRARWARRFGLWDPFRNLTEREVGQVLGFLSARRATSTIRLQSTNRAADA